MGHRLVGIAAVGMTLTGAGQAANTFAAQAPVVARAQCDASLAPTEAWFAAEVRRQPVWLKRRGHDPKARTLAAEDAWTAALLVPANLAGLKARGVIVGSARERCVRAGVVRRLVTEPTLPIAANVALTPLWQAPPPPPQNVTFALHLRLGCEVEWFDDSASFVLRASSDVKGGVMLRFNPSGSGPDGAGGRVVTYTANGSFTPGSYVVVPSDREATLRVSTWSLGGLGPFAAHYGASNPACRRHERRFEGTPLSVHDEVHRVGVDDGRFIITNRSVWLHFTGTTAPLKGSWSLPEPDLGGR